LIQSIIRLLHLAVKSSTTSPEDIRPGDTIIVTSSDEDITGIVETISTAPEDNVVVLLNTSSGTKPFILSDNNIIHIIKKANMLNLRKHNDYERDLKDMSKEDHQNKGRPEYGPEDKTDKSNLPASKISLSLRSQKRANIYYYVEDKGFDSRSAAEKYCDDNDYPHSKIKEEND